MATAIVGEDEDLRRRIRVHRDRRPTEWGTLEVGNLDDVLDATEGWDAVLVDSLTLWVSSREVNQALPEFEGFLAGVDGLEVPFVLVSDEVGLGVVPESAAGRTFRDQLGLVNQRAAAAAREVHFCVAGVDLRIR